jgi:hypothetical protein
LGRSPNDPSLEKGIGATRTVELSIASGCVKLVDTKRPDALRTLHTSEFFFSFFRAAPEEISRWSPRSPYTHCDGNEVHLKAIRGQTGEALARLSECGPK